MTNQNRPTENEYMTKARCHVLIRQTREGNTVLADLNARNGLIYAATPEARAAIVVALIWAGLQ